MRKKIAELRPGRKWIVLKILIFCWGFCQGKESISEVNADNSTESVPCNTHILCHVTRLENIKVANCSWNSPIFTIPEDLDEDINILDISYNQFQNFPAKFSLQKHVNTLTGLLMHNFIPFIGIIPASLDADIFTIFKKLEFLDISNCSYLEKPKFPSSLRSLQMQECNKNWNLSNLLSLEELHAAGNKYRTFPDLNKVAPLKFLDLRNNSIPYANINLEQLAPYCQLTHLFLNPQTALEGDTKETYCQCKVIEWWLNNTNVIYDPPNCRLPKISGPLPPCRYIASNEAQELRQECMSKIPLTTLETLKHDLIIIVILLLIIFGLSLPFVILARRKYGVKSRRKRKIRKQRVIKRLIKVGEEELEEEYYQEYEEEVEWEGDEKDEVT